MWGKWECTDPDCCQYIRKNDMEYEIVQIVWLDMCEENKSNGLKEYIVVKDNLDLKEVDDQDILNVLSIYGYKIVSLINEYGHGASDLIAECMLEESCLKNDCIVGRAGTFDEAKDIINNIVQENNGQREELEKEEYIILFRATGGLTIEADSEAEAVEKFKALPDQILMEEFTSGDGIEILEIYDSLSQT